MIKTCSGLPNGPTATDTDALSGDTCMVGWIEAGSHDDICPFSLGRYSQLVLPRTPPVDFDDYGNELDFSDPISDGDEDPD